MTIARMPSTTGINAATTAPKTTSRTMRAIGIPKLSPRSRSLCATSCEAWSTLEPPVCSTWKPCCPSAASVRASILSMLSLASSCFPVITKGRIVVCRSLDTRVGSFDW